MSTVVGRAIGVRREANPSNEAVEAKLQEFIDAMEAGPHAASPVALSCNAYVLPVVFDTPVVFGPFGHWPKVECVLW